jgi:branched-chain amino acid transport system substrate-binding protein
VIGHSVREICAALAAAVLLASTVPEVLARGLAPTAAIDLGVLINMSPTGDPDTQVALRLAVEDLNAFFVERHVAVSVRLTVEGTGLDPDAALAKVQSLAARRLKVVIGPESSGEAEAIKPFTEASDMILLSHCSTAPALAIPDDSLYRMVPSDVRQAGAIARLVRNDGNRVIVPIWRGDLFGDGLAALVRQRFIDLGGAVAPGVRFDPTTTDFSAEVTALAVQVEQARTSAGGAVAVVFLGFGTDGAAVLAQASEFTALGAVAWYGSDGTALSREILADPLAARFAVRVGFFSTLFADVHSPRADAVRTRISAGIGGGPVYYCAMAAYDAVWLAGLTAADTGTADIESFKRALVATADAYEGVTGPTEFDAAGDRADAAYDVWAIQDQGGALVWGTVARAAEH